MPQTQKNEILALVAIFLAVGNSQAIRADDELRELCEPFYLRDSIEPELSDAERRLVCGDPIAPGAESEGWGAVPIAQARTHLSAFLQARGFLSPDFEESNGNLIVDPGPRVSVSRVDIQGAPDWFSVGRRRSLKGQLITPDLLSETEQWAYQRFREEGYPCPTITAQAHALTGAVTLRVEPGERKRVQEVLIVLQSNTDEVFDERNLRRYDAFQIGDFYQSRLFAISAARSILDDVIEDTFFLPECEPGEEAQVVRVRQSVVLGGPRVFTAGAALDTERVGVVGLDWKHTRLGASASSLNFSFLMSSKEQELLGTFNWHYGQPGSRSSLLPSVRVLRQSETPYTVFSQSLRMPWRKTADRWGMGWIGLIGPDLSFYQNQEGPGENGEFFSIEAEFNLATHDFEFFQFMPRRGHQLKLQGVFNHRSFFSSATAPRVSLTGQSLWNYRSYEPPLWILGLRWNVASIFTSERPGEDFSLPANFLHYLGGTRDLRGFARKEIPRTGLGGLSVATASVEVRSDILFPESFELLAFVDAGLLGDQPVTLSRPLYWSPGIGARWQTPLGPLRGSLARGFTEGERAAEKGMTNWQGYLSLGEEF
jgi:translocation and assembly module TamA